VAQLDPSDRALDIGAGTGLLKLAAASHVRHVTALDISPAMCRHLEGKLVQRALSNLHLEGT